MAPSAQAALDRVRDDLARRRKDLIGLCGDLVAAPSINPPGDTREAFKELQSFFETEGIETEEISIDASMPNLVASMAGTGEGPHLIFNGHLDTMEPGDLSQWTVPLFELTEHEGRLHGLGMGNMKGAIAALALAFATLARHKSAWPGRLTFTGVSDEVVFGPSGTAHLLEVRPDLKGDAVISGEGPGWMRLAVAEKGVLWVRIEASSPGGHSSAAREGATASTRLTAMIAEIDQMNGTVGERPESLAALEVSDNDPAMFLTANIGRIEAGTFIGQIAIRATAEVDFRIPPGISIGAIEARLDEITTAVPGSSWTRLKGWEANWTDVSDPLIKAVQDAVAAVRGAPAPFTVRLPASDVSRWRSLGVPAVCFGPQPTYSAGLDDHAMSDNVFECAEVYAEAALRFLNAAPNLPGTQTTQEEGH